MAPDVYGNIIQVPGTAQVSEVRPSDIIASYNPAPLIKGCTIKSGEGVLTAGTVLKRDNATKKRVAYGGSGVAEGFLLETIDATSADAMGNIVLGGNLKLSKLIGLDAGAITTLNGRSDSARDLFIF